MKQDTLGLLAPLNKEQMNDLTKEIKETLAVNAMKDVANQRNFGSVDLWNMRRTQRTMSSMRKWVN